MSDARYPIGKFHFDGPPSEEQRASFINDIEQAPVAMRAAVKDLSPQDSHMNAYVRFKLALTEDEPTIKPYAEDRWAQLADTQSTSVEVSLALLESLHDRWVGLLRSLKPEDWKKTFRHPELGLVSLERNLASYAWHGKHHVAHITELRKRMGW